MTDLIESERDYVRDLCFTLDTYHKAFDGDVPDILKNQKDYVFNTIPDARSFHQT